MGRRDRERIAAIRRGEVEPIAASKVGKRPLSGVTLPTPDEVTVQKALEAAGLQDRFKGMLQRDGIILLIPKGR